MSSAAVFPTENIVTATVPEHARLSPDDLRIAYVRGCASKDGQHPASDIWLINVSEDSETRMTSGEWADGEPEWSPCGRYLAFRSNRVEHGTGQIFVLPVDGGEAVQVTDQSGNAHAPLWSPDGKLLAYLVDETDSEEEKNRKERDGDQWVVDKDPHRSHIWIVEVADVLDGLLVRGERPVPRRVSPEDVHVGTMLGALYNWLPDSTGIAAIVAEGPKVDYLWFADVATISLDGQLNRLGSFSGTFTPPAPSPDGSLIAFIGSGPDEMAIGVPRVIPVDGGKAEPLPFASGGSATGLAWLPEGRRLLVTLVTSLQSELYLVDIDSSDAGIAISTGDSPGTIAGWPSVSADGSSLAFIRTDSSYPPEIWHGTLNGDARPVTDLNPWTRDYPVPEVREISWRSNDGLEIFGLLYLPVNYEAGQRYPLLTHIHGGPMGAWTHRFYSSWHDWAIPMTQRGYAVLMPNPRGSSGRGPGYLAANRADLGGKEWEDIETGIDEVIRLRIADPDRLVVGGWSYGGYFTNWAITHSQRFKAAVTGASISNWVSFNGTTDVRRIFDAYFPTPVHEDADMQWDRSPVRYLSRVKTPTLVVHGDADVRVPIGQSYEMYGGLKGAGVETEFVVYPRQPHGILERKHQIDLMDRVIDWYERHLNRGNSN